jgi:hypothetical protein
MAFQRIRNYLRETRETIRKEWTLYNSFSSSDPSNIEEHLLDSDLRRQQRIFRQPDIEASATIDYKTHSEDTYYGFLESDHMKNEPFEFFEFQPVPSAPDNRQPQPGITRLPIRTHRDQVVSATDTVPESGFQLHPKVKRLVYRQYPQYIQHVEKLTRPLGTTDATFTDFNREQQQLPEIPTPVIQRILPIVIHFLGASRFLPLHWIDTQYAKMPLHTGTSYFYRHSYELKTHAAFSHPPEYAPRTTSKGYFYNAFHEWARTVTHHIKTHSLPFNPEKLSPSQIKDKLQTFFISHATMLFTRNHISDRDGALKQRPVYAMDTLFLHLECMLTFPLHIMARSSKSAIMYGIETVRGGCSFMDRTAQQFKSYLCIDWSSFDQRMPWIIVDTFFTFFLPTLLVISHGYQPTYEYPAYPDLTPDKLFTRTFNILCFLRTWYYNCVLVTADGWAYVRLFAGILSGMLNTQYLDSYCNLFLLIHGLIHFGCSDEEIYSLILFVMGDDNVILTHWSLTRLTAFTDFFEEHALLRFGMVLSRKKSLVTTLRTRIEMLGYSCNGGHPVRPLAKLVAQLCFPEHGPMDKYMSSRAVGMAWASAGQDHIFYQFCRDMYFLFLDDAVAPSDHSRLSILKHLPGSIRHLDNVDEFISIETFPDIHTIRDRYSHWAGPLDPNDKWDPAHFVYPADTVPLSSVTMSDYMLSNNITFPKVEKYF